MFVGKGVAIGINLITNSSYFIFVIIFFNKNSLWNHNLPDHTSMEEIAKSANRLGELATKLKNKLLENKQE